MEYNQRAYIAALQSVHSLGGMAIRRLINRFGSPKDAWEASYEDLRSTGFMKHKMLKEMQKCRAEFSFSRLEKELKKYNIKYITYYEDEYPEFLKTIYNPPAIIFYRGKICFSEKSIGIVGARRATPYGKNNSKFFARYLAERGVTIISGGARGIDTQSHLGALETNTPTISVMGCGLDRIYPSENRNLYDKIAENGMIISEYPPGMPPLPNNFPQRNRIISGLSRGVIVVEAKASSGSLITADMANNDGRDVFAIPGSINAANSEGTNWLIKQGAIPVTTPEDILQEYNWDEEIIPFEISKKNDKNNDIKLTKNEKIVLDSLSYDIIKNIDQLVLETKCSLSTLDMVLLKLEMNGFIELSETGGYTKVTRR